MNSLLALTLIPAVVAVTVIVMSRKTPNGGAMLTLVFVIVGAQLFRWNDEDGVHPTATVAWFALLAVVTSGWLYWFVRTRRPIR